jgi:ubiquinone/menaquinone biosynthesis C-methylase UbiE
MKGTFNTDTYALVRRINAHDKYGSSDFDKWALHQIDLSPGMQVLDLGCGTGKQSIPIADVIGDSGSVYCLDISEQALQELSNEARLKGLDKRIVLVNSKIDDLSSIKNHNFDIILSCYALYYTESPYDIFTTMYSLLRPGGILFFCGPSHNNNKELKQIHYNVTGEEHTYTEASLFMHNTGYELACKVFAKTEMVYFSNVLRFDSSKALFDYWRSYNLYNEKYQDEFMQAADKLFTEKSFFETTKQVIGIKAMK